MAYYSYNVYFNSNIVPPIVISAICVVIVFLPMVLLILARGEDNTRKKIRSFCLSETYAAISYVFKDAIQKVEERRKIKFVLFNQVISSGFIPALFLAIPGLFSCFFTSFWQVFLTGESYTCDPDLDCFPFDADRNYLQSDPIVNCSDFATSDNITIICYRFVYKFADGIGLIGGMLTFTAISVEVLGSVIVWSMRPDEKKKEIHCCNEWKSICFWFTDQGIDTTDDQDEEEEEEEETEESCRVCKHICCCCCCPLLKMIVRFMLVLVPSLSSVILLTLYFTVPSFNNVFSEHLSFASFFAYSFTIGYLGVLCAAFYVTLHRSIPYVRHQHVQ